MSRARLTYANIVSPVCIFLVLGGGTALAVTAIDDTSVFTRHIVNGQVKKPDLAADAVARRQVVDNSLTGADVQSLTCSTRGQREQRRQAALPASWGFLANAGVAGVAGDGGEKNRRPGTERPSSSSR